jgi:hypothetical protein
LKAIRFEKVVNRHKSKAAAGPHKVKVGNSTEDSRVDVLPNRLQVLLSGLSIAAKSNRNKM